MTKPGPSTLDIAKAALLAPNGLDEGSLQDVFGTILAMMRLSKFRAVSMIAGAYVNLMRAIPLVLVIFWFFFLVPYIGAWVTGANRPISVGAFWSAVITFTMFEAAYYCEIMRAGIQSISRDQVSAGYAMGLNY